MFWNRSKLAEEPTQKVKTMQPDYKNSRFGEIYLAGGCFWGVQAYFDRMIGVEYSEVGYANGKTAKTDYHSLRETEHAETLYLVYDPEKISLEQILGYYYGIIEPTVLNRQGNDIGRQYRTGIYYVDEADKALIEAVTAKEQEKYAEPIVTEILPLTNYMRAEEYHQDYLVKNPNGYCHIDLSNVPNTVPEIRAEDFPKPSKEEIREKLTDLQFNITQSCSTEYAFKNEYWDNHAVGLYVDVVTGEPLFLSTDKFDSGSGWPSFTKPIDSDVVKFYADNAFGMERVEVRSRSGNSHLGHVFPDGPEEDGGLRYCINSGALEFIPIEEMEQRGYGAFVSLLK